MAPDLLAESALIEMSRLQREAIDKQMRRLLALIDAGIDPEEAKAIRVVASAGDGWDHVSASRQHRCPNWPEMEHIKRLFFRDDETAMQLHVPPSDHVNCHPYCLHLWRPHGIEIPRPPSLMVGPDSHKGRAA